MAEKLTDEQLNDQNLAHIPHEDPNPTSTRVTPTPLTSVVAEEFAAGAAPFDDSTPPGRFQPVQNPEDSSSGIRSFHAGVPMDPATGGPSGARITPITVGSDTTGRMKKLFVANFPWDTSEPELRRHFEQVGEVVDVAIKRDRNGMPGIAFVTFTNESDARTGLW